MNEAKKYTTNAAYAELPYGSEVVAAADYDKIRAELTALKAGRGEDGCGCHGCGGRYTADLLIPDEAWEKIKPYGAAEGAGLLCPNCIMSRLVAIGWSAGHLSPYQLRKDEAAACACGDQYPANSYGAGFIVGSGMCGNCDAAIPARDITPPATGVIAPDEHVPDSVFSGEFQMWWEEHGQFCRAGGGSYERAFAFQAWRHLYPMLMQARALLAQVKP